jgi:hypothetical protein
MLQLLQKQRSYQGFSRYEKSKESLPDVESVIDVVSFYDRVGDMTLNLVLRSK